MTRLRRWLRAGSLRARAADPSTLDLSLLRAWTEETPPPATPSPLVAPPTADTPQQLKTRIARETVVGVVADASRPLSTSEVIAAALDDPKVQAAGIARGTLSAQLTAALAEEPARIVRLYRGMYAAAAPAPPTAVADGHSAAAG